MFLDADTLVLANSDKLFVREEFSAAPDAGWPDCFNSGVFGLNCHKIEYSLQVKNEKITGRRVMSILRSWRLCSPLFGACHTPIGGFTALRAASAASQQTAAPSALAEADKLKQEKKMSSAMRIYLQR